MYMNRASAQIAAILAIISTIVTIFLFEDPIVALMLMVVTCALWLAAIGIYLAYRGQLSAENVIQHEHETSGATYDVAAEKPKRNIHLSDEGELTEDEGNSNYADSDEARHKQRDSNR